MKKPFRRNNGIYYAILTVRGKQEWRSLETRDEKEAKERFEAFRLESKPNQKPRVSEFFSGFLKRGLLTYRPKTLLMYKQTFSNFNRLCGNKRISQIRAQHAEEFKLKRFGEVSPISVNIELRQLKSAMNDAVRLGVLKSNPFEDVRQVRVEPKEAAYLSEIELRKLLEAIDDIEFRNLILFTVLTSMRLGEITNLRWDDVDFERNILHVRSHGEFRVKGGRPRSVPMHQWITLYLRGKKRIGDYVFSNQDGRSLNPGPLSRRFKRYVAKANVDDRIHFHSLRHTGISWLINRGAPMAFVQRIAGHSSMKVTQGYTHLEDPGLQQAINVLNPHF